MHGHQITPWDDHLELERLRREFDVDFVITGHTNTYKFQPLSKGFHLNPGSVTGSPAQFVLIKLGNRKGTLYLYTLDRTRESKVQITKEIFSL